MSEKFLKYGSTFMCTGCPKPAKSSASKKGVKVEGDQVMSTKDTSFISSFGTCIVIPTAPKPCSPKFIKWIAYEPKIKIKGFNLLTTNSFIMCAMGGRVSPIMAGQSTAIIKSEPVICPLCGEDMLKHDLDMIPHGTNSGDGVILGGNILGGYHKKSGHKFYIVGADNGGIEAHHLICSEAMDDEIWERLCYMFGYDINKKENGVYLPNNVKYACHLGLPLHKGGHEAGFGIGNMRYPRSVKTLIDDLKDEYNDELPCDKSKWENFNKGLDAVSVEIFGYVEDFQWWITHDGLHYKKPTSNIGCANKTSLKEKNTLRSKAKKDYNQQNGTKITIKEMTNIRKIREGAYKLMDACDCGRIHEEFRHKPIINQLIISK